MLAALNGQLVHGDRQEWRARIEGWKKADPVRDHTEGSFEEQYVIGEVYKLTKGKPVVTTDVGQHQMWAAQWWPVRRTRSFLTSGGLGTMGFSLPAGMGAALANPEATVVVLTGDGSLLINIQELATIAASVGRTM